MSRLQGSLTHLDPQSEIVETLFHVCVQFRQLALRPRALIDILVTQQTETHMTPASLLGEDVDSI